MLHLQNGCTRIRRTCTIPLTHTHADHQFDTYEVPAAVISEWGQARFEQSAQRAKRGFAARYAAWMRKDAVRRLVGTMSTSAIGRSLGITEARVRQLSAIIENEHHDSRSEV